MSDFYYRVTRELNDRNRPYLCLHMYRKIKDTPCGYWVQEVPWGTKRHWISNTSKKKYAWPTIEEAVKSFLRRAEIYESILAARLEHTQEAARLAAKMLKSKDFSDLEEI